MRVSVLEATEKLDELIDLAEAGEEIILTLDGRDAVRVVPVQRRSESPANHLPE